MLVLRINVVAHDELEKEQIYQAGYPAHMALLAGANREERGEESHRTWLRLADLVDWAKATALEKLGEGERGLVIARAWLRPKLEPEPTLMTRSSPQRLCR